MDNQSSADLEAQAMSSTIRTEADPAEVFFDLLPTPEEIHGVTNAETLEDMDKRFAMVLERFDIFGQERDRATNDPDLAYIFNSTATGAIYEPETWMTCLENAMGYIALKNSRNGEVLGQGTKKDQLLAYYLWRLHGAKDETSPVQVPASTKTTASPGVPTHDFLPSSGMTRGTCSNCANAQATSWCSGCPIMKSGKLVFATFYCDHGCMKAHWGTHKPACKETRALSRAAAIFTGVWFERSELTNGGIMASVSEENGLIEAKLLPAELRPGEFQPFPRHVVASEEQVRACVLAGSCSAVIEDGTVPFDVLTRGEEAQF